MASVPGIFVLKIIKNGYPLFKWQSIIFGMFFFVHGVVLLLYCVWCCAHCSWCARRQTRWRFMTWSSRRYPSADVAINIPSNKSPAESTRSDELCKWTSWSSMIAFVRQLHGRKHLTCVKSSVCRILGFFFWWTLLYLVWSNSRKFGWMCQ